jgi:hypothetical protein
MTSVSVILQPVGGSSIRIRYRVHSGVSWPEFEAGARSRIIDVGIRIEGPIAFYVDEGQTAQSENRGS